MKLPIRAISVLSLCALAGAANAVALSVGSYTETFDGMGTSGTTTPADWTVYTGNSGTSNLTWATTITANGANSVASMIAAPTPLTAVTTPAATNNNGFNAALSTAAISDRVLATSPTTVSGAALQLRLNNATGGALGGLSISFDTVRYNATSTANELPGYWLFYSLDGNTWTNAASLNPTGATVPNTIGVTSNAGSVFFSTAVASGADFFLRWVDDNAAQTSPDQIIGLNNVSLNGIPTSVATIPLPGALPLLLAGLAGLGLSTRLGRSATLSA